MGGWFEWGCTDLRVEVKWVATGGREYSQGTVVLLNAGGSKFYIYI